jgi:hypothetical protein
VDDVQLIIERSSYMLEVEDTIAAWVDGDGVDLAGLGKLAIFETNRLAQILVFEVNRRIIGKSYDGR